MILGGRIEQPGDFRQPVELEAFGFAQPFQLARDLVECFDVIIRGKLRDEDASLLGIRERVISFATDDPLEHYASVWPTDVILSANSKVRATKLPVPHPCLARY